MLQSILEYLYDLSVSGYECLFVSLLPVVCLSMSGRVFFSFLGRKLVENRKGGMLKFFAFCIVTVVGLVTTLGPWVIYLILAFDVALQ